MTMNLDKDTLLVLRSAALGEGEPDLGEKLLGAFLSELLKSGTLPAKIICMNTGIFLTTEGSPVLDIMEQLEAAGVEIKSCGTCLAYYGRTDRLEVGAEGNMRETVRAMQSARKVLQP